MEDSMNNFFREKENTFNLKKLQNESNTDKLLIEIIHLLEKLVDKNKIQPYNSGPTNLPNAVITKPTDPDNINPVTGYTQILVKQILGRSPDIIYLVNNGPGDVFAISVRNSTTSTQSEYKIFQGDRGSFYNVDEIRIRTTTANTEYILTENEFVRPRDLPFLSGNPYISEQTLAVGATYTENIVTSVVPPLGLGHNAHIFHVFNRGPGNMTVQLSFDGISFTLPYTMLPTETLTTDDAHTVILTNVAGGNIYSLYAK